MTPRWRKKEERSARDSRAVKPGAGTGGRAGPRAVCRGRGWTVQGAKRIVLYDREEKNHEVIVTETSRNARTRLLSPVSL